MLRQMAAGVATWCILSTAVYGEETAEPAAIRQIDASSLFGGGLASTKVFLGKAPDQRAALCKGRMRDKPVVIRAKMSLTSLFESKSIRDEISRQVDFTREQIVLFAWTGRSGERMSAAVEASGDESTVVFYQLPRIGDGFVTTHHVHMYVLGKDVKWSLVPAPDEDEE